MVQSKDMQNHTFCLFVKWGLGLDTHGFNRVSTCVNTPRDVLKQVAVGCCLGVMSKICARHPPSAGGTSDRCDDLLAETSNVVPRGGSAPSFGQSTRA